MSRIYVASKRMRGSWAPRPEGSTIIDVTSAQAKNSSKRRDFSPMSEIKDGYKGFFCFENYWQSGKVIEGMDRPKQLAWWKKQEKGKRRYPPSKGKKVLHAEWDGKKYDYISSRKEIYVPQYHKLVKNSPSMISYKTWWNKDGKKENVIVVYDFDGPRKEDGSNDILEVSLDMIKKKINDPKFPFGHGYIVAATLAGIEPEKYCK